MHRNDTTTERLAFDIRMAQRLSDVARLDPVADPEIMLGAALHVACALNGFARVPRIQVTRAALSWPLATVATLTVECRENAAPATFAERRMYVCREEIKPLSVQVWVDPGDAYAAMTALRTIGGSPRLVCGWFIDCELDIATYEATA